MLQPKLYECIKQQTYSINALTWVTDHQGTLAWWI